MLARQGNNAHGVHVLRVCIVDAFVHWRAPNVGGHVGEARKQRAWSTRATCMYCGHICALEGTERWRFCKNFRGRVIILVVV